MSAPLKRAAAEADADLAGWMEANRRPGEHPAAARDRYLSERARAYRADVATIQAGIRAPGVLQRISEGVPAAFLHLFARVMPGGSAAERALDCSARGKTTEKPGQ